jgi:LmbE family N-acetylglucosaminyl deacetylase
MKTAISRLAAALLVAACVAGAEELGLVAFHQALRDIGTDLRLMCVAAHPDDEDGATLALYRKEYGLETFAVIATRGEGGQNEIGPELYDDLAVIRTREMQAAAAITGAELHFLDLPEFGYSKTIEETYAIWGEEETLRRLVRKVREVRPDIIITHHGKQQDHGHHQAIGRSLILAFDAAADPAQFPEQLAEGLEPWQASRLFIRTFTETPAAVAVPIGRFDALRGMPYTEIAARALEEHASQGMGFFIDRFIRGQQFAWYELEKEAPGGVAQAGRVPAPSATLLEGLYDRVSPPARQMSAARDLPDKTAVLAQLARHADQDAWQRLAAAAVEAQLEVWVDDAEVVPGQPLRVHVRLTDHGEPDLARVTFHMDMAPGFSAAAVAPQEVPFTGQSASAEFAVTIPADAPPTLPPADHVFAPEFLEPQMHVHAHTFGTTGATVQLTRPVRVDVAAPVSMAFLDAPYLVRRGQEAPVLVKLQLTNHQPGAASAHIALSPAPGLKLDEPRRRAALEHEGAQAILALRVQASQELQPRNFLITAVIDGADRAEHGVVRIVDLALPRDARVGVLHSYDDTYVTTLRKMGIAHASLTPADLNPITLDEFSSIVVDMRAYMAWPDLVAHNRALLDYVHRGGTLIVNYQKTFEWQPEYAPYPIRLSRNRVADKDAPVTLLAPEHPLFHWPNTITPRDWEGWRHERGLYFADQWDPRYTPLLAVADPGEDIPPGSFLIAQYGEGTYIYTALAWYRQLRELHPGALRLFANMLAARGASNP